MTFSVLFLAGYLLVSRLRVRRVLDHTRSPDCQPVPSAEYRCKQAARTELVGTTKHSAPLLPEEEEEEALIFISTRAKSKTSHGQDNFHGQNFV